MPLISISIDLSGSTYAKHEIVSVTQNEPDMRKDLYDEYMKLLYQLERSFYQYILESPVLDLANVYLVKTMGDEYWFTYEAAEEPDEFQAQSVSLLKILTNLIAEERFLAIFSSKTNDKKSEFGKNLNLPIKVFIDVMENPNELNQLRYEYLKGLVAEAGSGSPTIYKINKEYIEICNRLNLGSPDLIKQKHPVHGRLDFIGLEVDRFFRLTKFCKPSMLSIGSTLMENLDTKISHLGPSLDKIKVKKLKIKGAGQGDDLEKYVIIEQIPGIKMKGIGEDYIVNHVFGHRTLGDAVYGPVHGVENLMGETRAFLAQAGFYALEREQFIQ